MKPAALLLGLTTLGFWPLRAEDTKPQAVSYTIGMGMGFSGQPSAEKIESPQTGEKIGDFYISLAEGDATIIKYTGSAENLVIPEIIGGRRVLQIGEGAFLGSSNLVKVTLPSGLQKIGSYAFSACTNLETIYLPEGVQDLGSNAFYLCANLVEINLPGTLSVIRENTFLECRSLFGITFNEGLITIEDGAFEACVKLSEIFIPASLENISKKAFENCILLENIHVSGHNQKFIVREGENFSGGTCSELYVKDTNELLFSARPLQEALYEAKMRVIGLGPR